MDEPQNAHPGRRSDERDGGDIARPARRAADDRRPQPCHLKGAENAEPAWFSNLIPNAAMCDDTGLAMVSVVLEG